MKKNLLYYIILFVFAACTPDEKKIPKNILPIDKMKVVVWDLAQAGSYADLLKDNDSALKVLNTGYMAKALKLHNVSKEDFFKSFDFYQQNPLLNQVLFDSVSAYAERQKNDIYKRME